MAAPPPMAQAQTPALAGNQPMQTAGLLDTAKNFMMTPHPIGGAAAAPRPMQAPMQQPGGPNAAGQPAAVDHAVNSTFIGDINRGLQGGQK